MSSRPLLLLGDMAAITVTIAAFLQALTWTIAGILILASLIIPILASISPSRSISTHAISKSPLTSHHTAPESRIQNRPGQEHPPPSHQPSRTPPKQTVKTAGPQQGTKVAASTNMQGIALSPRPVPIKQGPNYNPTIAKGDYTEYEVNLDAGNEFTGNVTADGLVNAYLLDDENLDNLDQGEEFWSETGEESVEDATLEFTAPSKGTWFFVVENADDRAVSVTVKVQKGQSTATASNKQ